MQNNSATYRGNTLLFLDTGFFKNYKQTDSVYFELFNLSKEENVYLCTSQLCVREWISQKITDIDNSSNDICNKLKNLQNKPFLQEEFIDDIALCIQQFESHEESISSSINKKINQFIDENNIQVFPLLEKLPLIIKIEIQKQKHYFQLVIFKC